MTDYPTKSDISRYESEANLQKGGGGERVVLCVIFQTWILEQVWYVIIRKCSFPTLILDIFHHVVPKKASPFIKMFLVRDEISGINLETENIL